MDKKEFDLAQMYFSSGYIEGHNDGFETMQRIVRGLMQDLARKKAEAHSLKRENLKFQKELKDTSES